MGQFVRGAGRLEGSVVPELKDRFHFFILFGRRDVAFYEVTGGAQKFRGACLARGGGKLFEGAHAFPGREAFLLHFPDVADQGLPSKITAGMYARKYHPQWAGEVRVFMMTAGAMP